ncbi:hypothetical protein NL676_020375 [Syzygium grande]|nr:hypothetical protein NL676_020375 [Syzygium grande]
MPPPTGMLWRALLAVPWPWQLLQKCATKRGRSCCSSRTWCWWNRGEGISAALALEAEASSFFSSFSRSFSSAMTEPHQPSREINLNPLGGLMLPRTGILRRSLPAVLWPRQLLQKWCDQKRL